MRAFFEGNVRGWWRKLCQLTGTNKCRPPTLIRPRVFLHETQKRHKRRANAASELNRLCVENISRKGVEWWTMFEKSYIIRVLMNWHIAMRCFQIFCIDATGWHDSVLNSFHKVLQTFCKYTMDPFAAWQRDIVLCWCNSTVSSSVCFLLERDLCWNDRLLNSFHKVIQTFSLVLMQQYSTVQWEAFKKKIRDYLGIFPKRRTPPHPHPTPPFWERFVQNEIFWVILWKI